jgi:predicted translin family RNA/ssDNA-binding protein
LDDATPLWQQVEQDVQTAFNLPDFQSSLKRRRERESPSALIDVRKKPDTARSRIEKVLSQREAREKIERAADAEHERKGRDRKTTQW